MQNLLDMISLDNVIANAANTNAVNTNVANTDNLKPPPVFVDCSSALPSDITAISNVRLPGFWRNSPQQWFTHAEAIFHNQRVNSDLSRVNHLLAALDEDGIRTVSDLLGLDVQYSAIKSRLVSAYAVPQATRFRSIVQPGGMGDRRPSQLLQDMRSVLPDGIGDVALKEFWLQKLPPTILAIVAGLDGPLELLTERADRVADVSDGHDIAAVTTSHKPDRLRSIESTILALTAQISALTTSSTAQNRQSRDQSRQRSRSHHRSQSRPRNNTWCYYHNRYGNEARNCRDPCALKSEN